NTVSASTNTKFFQNADGKYHLVVYVVEDHVINAQASQGDNADHRYVLRTSFGGSTFGEVVAMGSIASGMEIQNTFTAQLVAGWNPDNLRYFAVIWEDVASTFQYINGNLVEETTVSSSIQLSPEELGISWQVQDDNFLISAQLSRATDQLQIQMMDLMGRPFFTKNYSRLPEGKLELHIPAAILPSGNYPVIIRTPYGVRSMMVVK
ncbi:MAG: Omp28-related outer membrane protein, partial [Saprospiraceae bacterium]|nr:Omp28-related outer membrane protein [Saprospiraceae bacterium]